MCPARHTSRNSRRGSTITLVAFSLVALLGFIAISVDGGGLLDVRRKSQATADAAAMAAAEALFRAYPENSGVDVNGSAAQAAYDVAALNGFDKDDPSHDVTVRTSPQTYEGGPHAGQPLPPGYVEVTVHTKRKRYFSAILGQGDIPVQARAVARGIWGPSEVAIHVLDLHDSAALTSTGESFIRVTGASVIVNSDSETAATSTGGVIEAPLINITGGSSVSGSKGGFLGEINYGAPPEPDPLRHIPEPDENGIDVQSWGPTRVSRGVRTLRPGTYRGGIQVSGQGNLKLEPGVYFMEGGGFEFSGQGDLEANGVMIFNSPKLSSDTVTITGTGSIVMSPPRAGIYKGLTLFQDRESGNKMTVSGGGYMDISGTFYTANGTLEVGGNGDSKVGSQYISRYLAIVGNGGLRINYNRGEAIPRRLLNLVE